MSLRAPEALAPRHSAVGFESGVPSLNEWIRDRALASQAVGGSRTFVACEADRIMGYYTLAAGGIAVAPRSRWGPTPQPIPVAVLGRVALDLARQRRGLGRALVQDAIGRLLQAAGAFPFKGLLVDAMSEDSRGFFAALGFEPSPVDEMTLLATFADLRHAARSGGA